jgi:hypothetical protein
MYVLLLCRATIGQAVKYINKAGREAYDDVIPDTFSSTLSTGFMCGLAYVRGRGSGIYSLTFYFMLPTYTMEANVSLQVGRRVSHTS